MKFKNMTKKIFSLKRMLLLLLILLSPAVWAQEPFLTIDITGKSYPYEVPEADAAKVFEKSNVTIAIELDAGSSFIKKRKGGNGWDNIWGS